jgi:chemotaxis protein CheD
MVAGRQKHPPAERDMLNTLAPGAGGSRTAARGFDNSLGCWTTKVQPGEFYITVAHAEEAITTVLGSCVAACIRDPVLEPAVIDR